MLRVVPQSGQNSSIKVYTEVLYMWMKTMGNNGKQCLEKQNKTAPFQFLTCFSISFHGICNLCHYVNAEADFNESPAN